MNKVIPEMDSQSMDIVSENISKLKELFPEAFTEGKVDFDALKEVLGDYIEGRQERYSFTWNGKSKARMLAQTPSTGTLRPCKEESVDWDNTQNLFIEGDNLEVLKLLQKSYHKKVKMIYIDPPYNTGSDFVYKDNFKDNIRNYKEVTSQIDADGRSLSSNPETSGRYHTDWLNMIYPRLKVARSMLSDDGVIFISIDDNEVQNLKAVLNEVYGEENFVGQMVWKKKYIGGKHAKHFVDLHEYVLVYAKNILDLPEILMERPAAELSKFKLEDEFFNDRGKYYTRPLKSNLGLRKTLIYPIEMPDGEIIETQWMVSKQTFGELIADGRIIFIKKRDGKYNVHRKYYEKDGGGNVKVPSLIDEVSNADGKVEIKTLFDIQEGREIPFDNPKPTEFISYLMKPVLGDGDLVLDFFAGSASTAHTVLKLNLSDYLNRKYIVVQLPESCPDGSPAKSLGYSRITDISKERIRRTATKIKEERPDYQGDLGFKVFKLDSTNIKPWELDFDLTEQDLEDQISNIKHGRKEEDVLYEVLLKYGLDLTLPITEHSVAGHKVFDIGMGALMICLSDNIALDVVEGIAKLKDDLQPEIMRVVFKDAGFADDVVKTNAVQILKQAGIEDVRSL
ncbi:site-specific DNA-methyltransferase [Halomonas sp. 86]|uniref:site-specific DNA-methyltransferase n=1 Tax=unclassified Halomonas TaxID=2609666 RepID=UPI004034B8D6